MNNRTFINGFELRPEIYVVNNRPCRVFIPPFDKEKNLYWVLYLDTEAVDIVKKQELRKLKLGKLLYGK